MTKGPAHSLFQQLLNLLDLKFGPAFFAIVIACTAFYYKLDAHMIAVDKVSTSFAMHQKDDAKKFEKLTNVAVKLESVFDDMRDRIKRVENRVDTIKASPQ